MANHKSAIKEHRQSQNSRDRNRFQRARMRTMIKGLRTLIDSGDKAKAQAALPEILSLVDRSAKHGAIAGNAASRYKSRLTVAVNKIA